MLAFFFNVFARRVLMRNRHITLAAPLAVVALFAAHGTARADRVLANGTVGTPYSQSVAVYTDPVNCTDAASFINAPGLNVGGHTNGQTCFLDVVGTPTKAGTYYASLAFMTQATNGPPDKIIWGPGTWMVSYTITIDKVSPTLSVAPSVSSLAYPNPVTLTATLSGALAPTGTITFFDNGTSIGTASVAGGGASLTVSSLSVGSHSITASYGGDDSDNPASTTAASTVTVTQATPAITLNTSSSSASYGSSVALVAGLSGAGAPTGSVTFFDGSTSLGTVALSGSTAILMVSSLPLGPHTITAAYNGDTNNASVTSSAVSIGITQYAPTVAISSSATSVGSGASVTLVATLSGGLSPTGSVTFYDGAAVLGSSTVSGSAVILTISSLSGGPHSIRAVYGGDGNNATATSLTLAITAGKAAPTISVSSSTPSPAARQSVTLTATLTGGASPTGSVTFKDAATVLGIGTISGSVATLVTSALGMGTHVITAVYGGDSNNGGATSGAVTLAVGRSDPTSDANVRGLVSSQVSSAVQFGRTQIANVYSRFEALHDEDDDDGDTSGGIGKRRTAQGGPATPSTAAAADFDNRAAGLFGGQPTGQAGAAAALGYADGLPIRTGLATQSDAGRAVSQLSAALPQAVDTLNKTNLLPFHVWVAGTVGFGRQRSDDTFDNRFTSSGLTLGLDRRILDGVKAGAAIGFGVEHTDIGSDGSRIDARSFDAMLYASWRFLPHTYLDVVGGYGALRFDNKR